MLPVMCLSRDAFPIVISLAPPEDTGTNHPIRFPVVAGSLFGGGRVICFSQLQWISTNLFRRAHNSKLVANSIGWLSGSSGKMTNVLMLGFEKDVNAAISASLKEIGVFSEPIGANRWNPESFDLRKYKVVIIPTDIDLSNQQKFDALVSYVKQGGGIGVFFNSAQFKSITIPINRFLLKFNLSYVLFVLNCDAEPTESLQIADSFATIRDVNLVQLLALYKATMKQSCIDDNSLLDLVSSLRYYIGVCDESHAEELTQICQYAWQYLRRTEFNSEEGLCPQVSHCIVILLLVDLYTNMKLPPDQIQPIPELGNFPGSTGEVELQDFELQIQIQPETWAPTGLWLPPGVAGYVECDQTDPDLHVQIGSHHESLLQKDGPWKRWPMAVVFKPLSEPSITLVTPFGGIAYIGTNMIAQTVLRSGTFTFRNFCRYPQVDVSDPSVWEATKDLPVPWGEFVTPDVIITLPTEELRTLDFALLHEKFHVIVTAISEYLAYEPSAPYRIVFDVDLPGDDVSCGYPLVFFVKDIDMILRGFDEPSTGLFDAIRMMTVYSIREGCFDPLTETAIATIASAVVFEKLFPRVDVAALNGVMLPPMFNELWEIETNFPGVISRTLEKFQSPDYPIADVPEDMWIAFVRELCATGQRDFTKLLERTKPIPLNISLSLQGLPSYVPVN
jgi:hypothetical protein